MLDTIFGLGQASTPGPLDDFWYSPVGRDSGTGVAVNEDIALTYATVYACVNKLSKTIATLPIHVFERTGPHSTENLPNHWLATVWREMFNPDSLATPAREAMMANLLLWGNAYCEIVPTRNGNSAVLYPLLSREVTPVRLEDGTIGFEHRPLCGPMVTLPASRVLHIPGLSLNGITGLSVIGYNRLTVGVGLAQVNHEAQFLRNGAVPLTVLERPVDAPDWTDDARNRVLKDWKQDHGGQNRFSTALLEEGMTVRTIGMPHKDAEFLASREFNRTDICGIFDVPPSKIHKDDRSTFNNIEVKNHDWRSDSILPHAARIETAVRAKFFAGTGLYMRHNLDGLVRGDLKSRAEADQAAIRTGKTVNEIRNSHELDGIGKEGDVSYVSMDIQPVDLANNPPEPEPVTTPANTPDDDASAKADPPAVDASAAFEPLFVEAAGRLVAKETRAVGNAWKKHAGSQSTSDFLTWCEEFYGKQEGYAKEVLSPIVEAYCQMAGHDCWKNVGAALAHATANGYATNSMAAVRDCLATDPAHLPDELKQSHQQKIDAIVKGCYLSKGE